MDAEVVTQRMVTQQLLRKDIIHGFSNYQKNILILHQLRMMNKQDLLAFIELLQTTDSHKHIGKMLSDGK